MSTEERRDGVCAATHPPPGRHPIRLHRAKQTDVARKEPCGLLHSSVLLTWRGTDPGGHPSRTRVSRRDAQRRSRALAGRRRAFVPRSRPWRPRASFRRGAARAPHRPRTRRPPRVGETFAAPRRSRPRPPPRVARSSPPFQNRTGTRAPTILPPRTLPRRAPSRTPSSWTRASAPNAWRSASSSRARPASPPSPPSSPQSPQSPQSPPPRPPSTPPSLASARCPATPVARARRSTPSARRFEPD